MLITKLVWIIQTWLQSTSSSSTEGLHVEPVVDGAISRKLGMVWECPGISLDGTQSRPTRRPAELRLISSPSSNVSAPSPHPSESSPLSSSLKVSDSKFVGCGLSRTGYSIRFSSCGSCSTQYTRLEFHICIRCYPYGFWWIPVIGGLGDFIKCSKIALEFPTCWSSLGCRSTSDTYGALKYFHLF